MGGIALATLSRQIFRTADVVVLRPDGDTPQCDAEAGPFLPPQGNNMNKMPTTR
jgi:hypothetical protein